MSVSQERDGREWNGMGEVFNSPADRTFFHQLNTRGTASQDDAPSQKPDLEQQKVNMSVLPSGFT